MPSLFPRFIMLTVSFPTNLIYLITLVSRRDFAARMLSNCALYDCVPPPLNPTRTTLSADFCEALRGIVSALKFSRQPESSLDLIRLASFVTEFTEEENKPSCVENMIYRSES